MSRGPASCKVAWRSMAKTGAPVLKMARREGCRGRFAWLRRQCVGAGGGGYCGRHVVDLGVIVAGVREGSRGGAAAHVASSVATAHVAALGAAAHAAVTSGVTQVVVTATAAHAIGAGVAAYVASASASVGVEGANVDAGDASRTR